MAIVRIPIQFAIRSKISVVLYIETIPCSISITAPNKIDSRDAKSKLDFDLRTYKLINQSKQNVAYKMKCAILSSKPVFNFGMSPS